MDLTPMQLLVQNLTGFVATVFTVWLPAVLEAITDTSILTLFVVCVPLVGIAIGVFNRLVKAN